MRHYLENLYIFLQRFKYKLYTIFISPLFLKIGEKSSVVPPFRYRNLAQVELGNFVTINGNCWIQVVNYPENNKKPKLIIKDYASIGMNTSIAAAEMIIIEEHVFTGRNVFISDHGHEFSDINVPIARQAIVKVAPVVIGTHTWIGQNAVILSGVTIGRHCVIGANSVVTRDVPSYSVVVGAPARVIKRYTEKLGKWEKL